MPAAAFPESDPLLRLCGVSKAFGPRVLFRNISAEFRAGSITLLAGANGAGKSTLMRIMAGLGQPDSGKVERLTDEAESAFLAHATFIYSGLSARENLLFWGQGLGLSAAERNAAADAAALENLEKQLTLFRDQMQRYDDCLQEMRKLNLKNIESAQGVQELTAKANEKLDKTLETVETVETISVSKIKETSERSIDGINKALNEGLKKIAEIQENPENIEKLTRDLADIQTKTGELFQNLEEYLHTDNVKVYRNVQASMIEELDKQTALLQEGQNNLTRKSQAMFVCVIITMVIALTNIAVTFARILGLF